MPEIQEQIITRPEDLALCCEHLAGCPVFGFDTEFVGEDTYHPHLCLVQVATPERLIIIDPLAAGPLDAFWQLVTDSAHQAVVHAGREEVRLCRLWTGHPPGNLFDLQIAAGMAGLPYPLGHAALVSQVLGVQLSKAETLTEWRDRPLTRAQIRYALDDVRYLLPLWRQLTARLQALQRSDWAHEEFSRLVSMSCPDEPGSPAAERWRKLRGLGSLDRRRLAAVRGLFFWREETAARTNRPARSICRDDLLVEIARRNPQRERELLVMRGLPKRDLKAILEAVEQARSLPLEQCPAASEREQDLPQVTLVANVLGAVLGNWCVNRRLAPNLAASAHDLKMLVRARRQGETLPPESLLAQGWRGQHLLPELLTYLDGAKSLRIANLAADAPFALDSVRGKQL